MPLSPWCKVVTAHADLHAGRLIAETINARLVRHAKPDSKSREYVQYLPFWLM
jgi:hypothetical protein